MGNWKNQSSIMLEDYEESTSLTLRTRSSREPLGMLERKLETPMAPAMPCKGATELGPGRLRPAFVTELGPTELRPSELGPTDLGPVLSFKG